MCPGVKPGSGLDYASGVKSVSTCFGARYHLPSPTAAVDPAPPRNRPYVGRGVRRTHGASGRASRGRTTSPPGTVSPR